ncbi:MAG: cyclic nucleotide-binding domain-containing protein [Verrucomicrobiota bacterium]
MPEWIQVDLPMLPPVGLLAYLSAKSLGDLAHYGKFEKFQPGETLIQEGDPQTRLYIVVQGSLQISGRASGKEIVYCQIEAGECLGEVCLFEAGNASATVQPTTECVLWSLDIHELIQYLTEHLGGGGALLMGIARCLSHRLRSANQQIAKSHVQELQVTFSIKTAPLRVEAPTPSKTFLSRLSDKLKGHEEPKSKISTEIKL